MNLAIILKTWRETWPLWLLCTLGVVGFEMLLVLVIGSTAEQLLEVWARIPFLQRIFKAMLGVDLAGEVTIGSLMTLGLVHPIIFAMLWVFLLTTCTRVIAGEIDRGTADLLIALPISRASLYVSVSVVWIVATAGLCVAVWIGLAIGQLVFRLSDPLPLTSFVPPLFNLFALLLAIGSAALLATNVFRRRGTAVGVVVGALLVSMAIEFVAAAVPEVARFAFLGALAYYRPPDAIRSGQWPVADIAGLTVCATAMWTLGMVRFSRRDIPAA